MIIYNASKALLIYTIALWPQESGPPPRHQNRLFFLSFHRSGEFLIGQKTHLYADESGKKGMTLQHANFIMALTSRVTRSGDFSPKNATNLATFLLIYKSFGLFFAKLLKCEVILCQNSDFGIFENFCLLLGAPRSGSW